MIAYTALLLVVIGIFGSFKVSAKVDRLLSFLTFVSLFCVFANFCNNMLSGAEHSFLYEWYTPRGRRLNMNLISNSYNYILILPCFIITLLFTFNNQIFRYEERRCSYNAILIFNLATLIVLITSNNFVQLLAALFIVDIISFFIIRNIEYSRRYILLNMSADMLLFMVSAIINSKLHSLEFSQIALYREIGIYPNFVAFIGLTAIFMKLGFFCFQIGLMGIKNIRMHRLQNIMLLSSPLAALLLLLKFSVLWRVSEYFTIYLDLGCGLTILWAFIGSICANKIKAKIIYWQMMLWALLVELLRFHGFVWFSEFTYLLIEIYILSAIFYLAYFYNRRRQCMTEIIGIAAQNKIYNMIIFAALLPVITALANTLTIIYNPYNRYYIWTFAVLFLFSLCNTINQVYRSSKTSETLVSVNKMPFKWILIIQLLTLSIILLYHAQFSEVSVYGIVIAFIVLSFLFPLRKLIFLYRINFLQNGDILGKIYIMIIKSLRLCGKFFRLMIDQFFLERIIINSSISITKALLFIFRKLHTNVIAGIYVLLTFFGIIFWLAYNKGVLS